MSWSERDELPSSSTGDLTSTCSTSFSFFNGGGHGGWFGNGWMSNSKKTLLMEENGQYSPGFQCFGEY